MIFFFFFQGSRDNMSIIIVTFPGAPKVMQEEVERDNICNQKIEKKIKGNSPSADLEPSLLVCRSSFSSAVTFSSSFQNQLKKAQPDQNFHKFYTQYPKKNGKTFLQAVASMQSKRRLIDETLLSFCVVLQKANPSLFVSLYFQTITYRRNIQQTFAKSK